MLDTEIKDLFTKYRTGDQKQAIQQALASSKLDGRFLFNPLLSSLAPSLGAARC